MISPSLEPGLVLYVHTKTQLSMGCGNNERGAAIKYNRKYSLAAGEGLTHLLKLIRGSAYTSAARLAKGFKG